MAVDKTLARQRYRNEFHTETESSETSEVLIRRKKGYMWIHTRVGSERDSHPCANLNHFCRAFFWVSSGQSSCLSGSEPVLGDLSVLPCMCAHLLAKMDSSKEAYG